LVSEFKKAFASDPSFAAAAHNLGTALARQARTEEAIEAFHAAIRLRPTLGVSHYGLAVLLRSKGEPSAEEEFRKARELQELVPPAPGTILPYGSAGLNR
jgi:Flp pilus assembly protein TadD